MDHDHNHSSGGGNGVHSASCPMIMMFHAGYCEQILWKGWVASTVTEFVFSCLAFFLMAFFYEALKFLRTYLLFKNTRREFSHTGAQMNLDANGPSCTGCSNTQLAKIADKKYSMMQHILNWPHLVQCLLNVVQVIIAYLLMLVFMNFNYWLCLAVILGLGFGYFCFGWIKMDVYENECCQ